MPDSSPNTGPSASSSTRVPIGQYFPGHIFVAVPRGSDPSATPGTSLFTSETIHPWGEDVSNERSVQYGGTRPVFATRVFPFGGDDPSLSKIALFSHKQTNNVSGVTDLYELPPEAIDLVSSGPLEDGIISKDFTRSRKWCSRFMGGWHKLRPDIELPPNAPEGSEVYQVQHYAVVSYDV